MISISPSIAFGGMKSETDDYYEYYYDYLQYQLFEEDKYLNLAYSRLNDITKKLNDKDRKKLLNCPWPKMIIEEWEKNN